MNLGALFMQAGIIVAIIFAVVQVFKAVFNALGLANVKKSNKNLYKFLLTLTSLVITAAAIVLNELYVVGGNFYNIEFVITALAVGGGVFVAYNGIYEGFALRELIGIIWQKIKLLSKTAPESKLRKLIDKVGVDKVDEIVKAINQTNNEIVQEQPTPPTLEN